MAEKVFTNDAELAVLSILFKNPDSYYKLEGLRSFMFSSLPHQAIFKEIEEMAEKQIPADPALLIASLESSGEIGKVGGKKYIDHIVGLQHNTESLDEWKKLVVNAYKTRCLISMRSRLSSDNINTDNVDNEISEIRKSLDSLMEVRGGTQTILLGDVVKEVYQEIISRHDNPGLKGASWGIREIDQITGGKCPGELWVIGGRPGAGKTAFICNSILTDALEGKACLVFEREMRTQELAERFISILTGIPITNIRLGVLDPSQIKSIYEALEKLKHLPIFIDTSYRSNDVYYIESTIQKYKKMYDIKVVYLDYIQILIDRDENQTQEIGRISRTFKTLSNELGICSVLISQLNRGVEMRENKRPVLSDLRQSGNLEEDADFVVGLYRDEYYNKETNLKNLMEFIILKFRNGPIGSITVKFDNSTNRITSTGD